MSAWIYSQHPEYFAASPKQETIDAVFLAVIVICIAVFLLLLLKQRKVFFTVDHDSVTVKGRLYFLDLCYYRFKVSEIQDLVALPCLPDSLGPHIRKQVVGYVRSYGEYDRVYTYDKSQAVIQIALKNTAVFLGGKTPEETRQWEETLKREIEWQASWPV